MSNTIEEIFKIDRVGKGIAVKILFAFLVVLRITVSVFPIGSNDFDNLLAFSSDYLADPNIIFDMEMTDFPVSTGNLIYIGSLLLVEFICLCCFYLYVGMMIRDMRKGVEGPGPVSVGELILRLFILCSVTFVVFLPAAAILTIILLYLFVFFIIIFPWLFMYPACYLSGDSGFFMSFVEVYKKNRGYYFVNVRNLAIIMLASLVLQAVSMLIGEIYEPVAVVLDSFIYVFTLFCIARYSCLIYRRMVLHPIRIKGPVEPLHR